MIKAQQILELFKAIGREDISLEQQHLFTNGIIDSIDYLALIDAIESKWGALPADSLMPDNFESVDRIADTLNQAFADKE